MWQTSCTQEKQNMGTGLSYHSCPQGDSCGRKQALSPSSTSLPSPVIPSGFIHVKHKDMNEKPCEAERRRGKEGQRI